MVTSRRSEPEWSVDRAGGPARSGAATPFGALALSVVPQLLQKRAPARLELPQFGQFAARGEPH
jgi:hypothetical protein